MHLITNFPLEIEDENAARAIKEQPNKISTTDPLGHIALANKSELSMNPSEIHIISTRNMAAND